MARYDALPPSLPPRGLTREAAAAFVGLSLAAFDSARARGSYPGPTLPGGRYDRMLLENAADRLSGLGKEAEASSELDIWRTGRAAR